MTTYNLVAAGDSITQTIRSVSATWLGGDTLITVGDTAALRVGDLITDDGAIGGTLEGAAITAIVNATQIRTAVTNPLGINQMATITFRSIWKYDQQVKDALAALYPGDTWNLVNNGASGWTSNDVWTNFSTVIGDESPSVVLLMVGTNDAYRAREGAPGDGANYSPLAVRARVENIIRSSLALTDSGSAPTRVVVLTPPPASEQADGYTLWRHRETLNGIAGAVMDAARGIPGVSVVDAWRLMQDANASWKTAYLYDGLHVDTAGHDLLADLALPAVLAELKRVYPTQRRIDPVATFATERIITAAGTHVTLTPATETDAAVAVTFTRTAAPVTPSPPEDPGYRLTFDIGPYL